MQEKRFKIALKAVPEDNQANEELIRFLAEVLGTSKSNISIIRGKTSRLKQLSIEGVSEEEVLSKLS